MSWLDYTLGKTLTFTLYIIHRKKLSNILVNEIGIIKDRLSDYKTVL